MSTIKITNLTSSGAIVGNVVLPVVGNVAGTLTTLKATVDQLKTFITAGAEANISLANSIQSAQISAANVGIIGYIGLGNTTTRDYIDGQILAANAGVTSANLGMKGYVDSVASQSIYGNANVASFLSTYSGNLNAKYATFTGDTGTGLNALTVGLPGIENFGNVLAQFHANINTDVLVAVHNKSNGPYATSGFMATADIGDETIYRSLMGIFGSGFDTSLSWVKPLDSVLLGVGGNLVIGAINLTNDEYPLKDINFVIGSNNAISLTPLKIHAESNLSSANLELGANVGIIFSDGSRQTSAYSNVQVATYLPTYTGNVSFTMANTAHWTSNVNTISDALNQLAERIYNIENP